MAPVKRTKQELGLLCRSLAELYHAGVGAGDALTLLARDAQADGEREQLTGMAAAADAGASLAGAFRQAEGFPDYLCALLEVGDQTGKTEQTLYALASHYEQRGRMERRLRSALVYPCVLLLVLLAVAGALLMWVLPVFNDVYARLGSSLTGVAGGLLLVGNWLRQALPGLGLGLVLLTVATVLLLKRTGLRGTLVRLWRKYRSPQGAAQQLDNARVAQALALGMGSGMNDEQALELALGLAPEHTRGRDLCRQCLDLLQSGQGLAAAARQTGLLPAADCRLLDAGVRAGRGEVVMEQIASRLLEQGEEALERTVSRIEPALVAVTCALVGGVLLTVMLPLMHILSGIG